MKLTPRQQTFLDKLFELYREFDGPVHYSVVAERLGVNRFSAYDMLKLLEEKGVAASSYSLKADNTGPGRSMVVFYPTYQASKFLTQLREEMFNNEDWQQFKDHLLEQLRQAQDTEYSKAVSDFLTRLPDVTTPLKYCSQMVGVLLLNLAQASGRTGEVKPSTTLSKLVTDGQAGLGTLAGLSLGSLLSSKSTDPSFMEKLVGHTREFQAKLNGLSEESLNSLNSFAKDAMAVFESLSQDDS